MQVGGAQRIPVPMVVYNAALTNPDGPKDATKSQQRPAYPYN